MALCERFNRLNGRLQMAFDLGGGLGSCVRNAQGMPRECERLHLLAIRALPLFPSLDLGSLGFSLGLCLWTIRGDVGPGVAAGQGLLGLLKFLVGVAHTPAYGQSIALADLMHNMEEIWHAQTLQPLFGEL